MTKEQREIQEEIYGILKSKCEGNGNCSKCKHLAEGCEFEDGCLGKIAIDLIIAARAKQ